MLRPRRYFFWPAIALIVAVLSWQAATLRVIAGIKHKALEVDAWLSKSELDNEQLRIKVDIGRVQLANADARIKALQRELNKGNSNASNTVLSGDMCR